MVLEFVKQANVYLNTYRKNGFRIVEKDQTIAMTKGDRIEGIVTEEFKEAYRLETARNDQEITECVIRKEYVKPVC